MTKLIALILFSTLLTACMSMPYKAMYKMATLDPLSLEPHDLKLALRTEQTVEVATGSVVMQLEYSMSAQKGFPTTERKHKFNVAVERFDTKHQEHQLPDVLLDGIGATEQVTLLYLNEQDAEEMSETLKIVREHKAADIKGKGMIGFSFNQNCLLNTQTMKSLEVDLFVKTAKAEGFFMLFDDVDVIEQAHDEDINLKQLNKCDVE